MEAGGSVRLCQLEFVVLDDFLRETRLQDVFEYEGYPTVAHLHFADGLTVLFLDRQRYDAADDGILYHPIAALPVLALLPHDNFLSV